MNHLEDTIAAISTPLGFGGLGIVRLSGKDALEIAQKIFVPKNKSKVISQLKTFTLHLGYIIEDGKVIDEVLMSIMRAPHSYTCEDVVEFSCHGGPVILKKILELCIKNGARLAEPGEFTKRAFLNGRIDLTQAEAVCDLIFSQSDIQSQIYAKSLLGGTKETIRKIIDKIEEIIALVDATIEYPEEEETQSVNYSLINSEILKLKEEVTLLIENSQKITPILTGVNLAIVGKVNVGKSSLLNILLNYDRAIVSDIPGTTRDTISETINLNGLPIRIIDTAGIRQHQQDVIEKIGIQRTKQAIKQADIILFMLDGSVEVQSDDFLVADVISEELKISKKVLLIVINKQDKPLRIFEDTNKLKELLKKVLLKEDLDIQQIKKESILISCITKQGIKELQQRILDAFTSFGQLNLGQDIYTTPFVVNMRQLEILKNVDGILQRLLKEENIHECPELIVENLRDCLNELKKIIGINVTEEVLDIIFSRFCVGK